MDVEGQEVLFLSDRRNEAGVSLLVLGRAVYVLIEVGLDLEELAKLGVGSEQSPELAKENT